MPAYDALCRAPLLKPAFTALPTGQLKPEGYIRDFLTRAAEIAGASDSALDRVARAAILTEPLPKAPEPEHAEMCLNTEPRKYLRDALAAMMIAVRERDKLEMLRVLDSVSTMNDAIPSMSHGQKLQNGADMLRLIVELYRRTGQRFLLEIMETLRAQLPDAAGFFHTFPLVRPFTPEEGAQTEEQATYQRHMRRMARGRACADALSVTTLLSQYSGSAREQSAASVGVTALERYHGSPGGMFLSSPYLAGRDPSQPVELRATCHMLEALYDCVLSNGDMQLMDTFERIVFSSFAPAFTDEGIAFMQPVSSLPGAEKTEKYPLSERRTSKLIDSSDLSNAERGHLYRALYAVRGLIWVASGESAITLLCPVDSTITTLVGKSPVRVTVTGGYPYHGKISIKVELKAPTAFTLSVRIPSFAKGATICLKGREPIPAEAGRLFPINREFRSGDEITVELPLEPRTEEGYRSSRAVLVGSVLMVLPAAERKSGWQYGLYEDSALTFNEDDFTVTAEGAPMDDWAQRGGYPAPPPQGVKCDRSDAITLVPVTRAARRIALFPGIERA